MMTRWRGAKIIIVVDLATSIMLVGALTTFYVYFSGFWSFIFVLTESIVVYKELANSVYAISSCLEYVKKVLQIRIFFQQIFKHSYFTVTPIFQTFRIFFFWFFFASLHCLSLTFLPLLSVFLFCKYFWNATSWSCMSCSSLLKLSCVMVLFRLYKYKSNIWNESNFVYSCNINLDENLLWNTFHPTRFFSFWIFTKF